MNGTFDYKSVNLDPYPTFMLMNYVTLDKLCIFHALKSGDGYIFSKSVKQLPQTELTWVLLNNDFKDVSYNLVDYGFYIGKVKEEEKCEIAVGDGTGTADDALWNGDFTAGFLRWQIQCDVDKDAIMKITAKENVNIVVTHTPIWNDAWSTFTSVRYYVMDLDGTLLKNDKSIISYKLCGKSRYRKICL